MLGLSSEETNKWSFSNMQLFRLLFYSPPFPSTTFPSPPLLVLSILKCVHYNVLSIALLGGNAF